MVQTCTAIAAPTVQDAIAEGRRAITRGSDLVEFRLDQVGDLSAPGIRRLAQRFGRRAIATVRSEGQGGRRRRGRTRWLELAATAGFGFLDVEVATDRPVLKTLLPSARANRTEVIASHHFLEDRPPGKIREMLERCCRLGDIGKVAVSSGSIRSALGLLDLARRFRRRRFILIGMGVHGAITRVLAAEMGIEIQYVRPDAAEGTAPGQLSLSDWQRRSSRPGSAVTGLVGRPIGHSLSMAMQNAAQVTCGLGGIYLPFELGGPAELAALLETPGLGGLNVTMPFKEKALDLLDRCDPESRRLGAVNTILIGDGEAVGFNTDLYGFRRLLDSVRVKRAERALVLGAGGAARAVVDVLSRGIAKEIRVLNRSATRARRLVRWSGGKVAAISSRELRSPGAFDLVVNCTPVGTSGLRRRSIVPDRVFRKGVTLVDLVYNPLSTPLMKAARRRGARVTGGLEMLVQQGGRSFQIWTGRKPPLAAMRRAARKELEN